MNNELWIDPVLQKSKIVSFIKNTLQKQGFKNVVIGMSGGLDSTTSFYLLKEVVAPQNIFVAHLYYFESQFKDIEGLLKKPKIPKENIYEISIAPLVEAFQKTLAFTPKPLVSFPRKRESRFPIKSGMTNYESAIEQIRLGNIMVRARMIILYDLAKKHNALVCGTENKSEYLLGYFTRFGDQASDFEPIQHLYKTQVHNLAKFIGVPKHIIGKTPTAGLWTDQTDEDEFGFTYKDADQVLHLYYDKKLKLEEIKNRGFKNTEKIINFSLKNSYKHHTPYILKTIEGRI